MICPACGTDNREGARFCRGCGLALDPEKPDRPLPDREPPADEVPIPSQDLAASASAADVPAEDLAVAIEGQEPASAEPEAGAAAESPVAELEPEKPGAMGLPEETVRVETESGSMQEDEMAEPLPEPEGVLAFWREKAEPLTPASPGTTIAGRYVVVEILSVQDDEILYLADDLQGCWQCGFEKNTPGDAFCAQCGASLDHKPAVRVLEVRHVESEPASSESVAARLVDKDRAFLVLAGAPPEPPAPPVPQDLRLVVGQRSDPGQVRELNEDSLLALTLASTYESRTEPLIGLFAVADGMGGHEGGEVASKMALQVLADNVMRTILLPVVAGELVPEEDVIVHLRQAAIAANDSVFLARHRHENDMGTTLTVALIRDGRLFLAHVGDCRAYRWTASGLEQLTIDHSVVASMVASGQAAPEEIYTHPHRSIIYRCIGDKPVVDVDTAVMPMSAGDRIVLCSDGLWEAIRDEGIEEVLMQESDPQAACDRLVRHANVAGGEDNISVVVVRAEEAARQIDG